MRRSLRLRQPSVREKSRKILILWTPLSEEIHTEKTPRIGIQRHSLPTGRERARRGISPVRGGLTGVRVPSRANGQAFRRAS